VEWRQLADRGIDLVSLPVVRVVEERHINLHRGGGFQREVLLRDRPEHRLAADDEDIRVVSDLAGGSQDMLQLLASHAARFQPLRLNDSRTF
jgi:hypothetical protein